MIVKLEKQMVYAKAELEQQKIQAKITQQKLERHELGQELNAQQQQTAQKLLSKEFESEVLEKIKNAFNSDEK